MSPYCVKILNFLCALQLFLYALAQSPSFAAEAHAYNPYLHKELPGQSLRGESADMAHSLGAQASHLQREAQFRPHLKSELYPVIFGSPTAPNEILVFLDYNAPQSALIWQEIMLASQQIRPEDANIVLFMKNSEAYGTDLTGGALWVARTRPQSAMDYMNYTLTMWNSIKNTLRSQGIPRPFLQEYDTTLGTEYPLLYQALERVSPAIPSEEHFSIAEEAFNAGNINAYQAAHAAQAYELTQFPAVVVNGHPLHTISAQQIRQALSAPR